MTKQILSLCAALTLSAFALPVVAQTAPKGWTAVDTGIEKGTAKVTLGEIQDLNGNNQESYLATIENTPPKGTVLISSGGIKDGKYVVQVKREITVDGIKARSVLMICKNGQNKNKLLEIYAENSKVMDLIGGAKYAINHCSK